MDAANLIKPPLARGELRCIGATTLDEYRKYVEKDAAFERRFQQVLVKEPSVEETISILRGLKEKYESHFGVRITDAALVQAAVLANRYITQRFLPDKAIDVLDEACSAIRVQLDSQPEIIDQLQRRKLQLEVEKLALTPGAGGGQEGLLQDGRAQRRDGRQRPGHRHRAEQGAPCARSMRSSTRSTISLARCCCAMRTRRWTPTHAPPAPIPLPLPPSVLRRLLRPRHPEVTNSCSSSVCLLVFPL